MKRTFDIILSAVMLLFLSPVLLLVAIGGFALELALLSIGIQQGDEVIVTPRTFITSASSVVLCGATPKFADVDRDRQNPMADTIRPCITTRTRTIVVVHLAGWPCDMDPIIKQVREHDLVAMEDCAQTHGATYKGKRLVLLEMLRPSLYARTRS